MSTTVVNVKVQYIRPKYKNLQEWSLDENNVYIGRAGIVFIDKVRYPKINSKWHNPFTIKQFGSRENVLKLSLLKKLIIKNLI